MQPMVAERDGRTYNNSNNKKSHGYHPPIKVPPPPGIFIASLLDIVHTGVKSDVRGRYAGFNVQVGFGGERKQCRHDPG